MPATLHGEAVDSRSRSGGNPQLIFIVKDTDDDAEAVVVAIAAAPPTHDGYVRQGSQVDVTPLHVDENDSSDGNGWWLVTVPYGVSQWSFDTGSDSYTFDTSGGTQHITHSHEVVGSYAASGTAPNIGTTAGGPIGATADGVEGADIVSPVFEWEETHIFGWGDVDDTYKRRVTELTGTTNDATFRGYAIGEVLFLGCRGARLPDNTGALTFHFAASLNRTGVAVGAITGIAIKGWEHLDLKFDPQEIGASPNNIIRNVARFAYVHRVYLADDFGDLGI